ncbi:MAG: coagulation factor 5/8 type domain protein, partial [Pedosphaera sp.]|nr:coagulation factor 5/8 type domain protein [Pedosphaera sp.]
LAHPNGWWRDTAQKLLILRGDKSVVPALVEMTRSHPEHLARIHALWTLEGLDALQPSLIREKLQDKDPQVRVAAIRTSETLYKKGDHSLVPDLIALAADPDANVVIQMMMTANMLKWPDWQNLISSTTSASKAFGVKKMGTQMVPTPPAPQVAAAPTPPPPPSRYTADEMKVLERGEIIYKELCFVCHAPDGKGTPLAGGKPGATMAPPLGGSRTITGHLDNPISVVLKGLSGPVNDRTYDAQMVPMESNDDAWISSVISYIRNNFGNHSTFISTNDVARVRAAITSRTNAWTLQELHDLWPQVMTNRQQWKLTASHNPGGLPQLVDGNLGTRYDTRASQEPGMWVQVELPDETELTGVELDSGTSEQDYARGYKVELSKDGTDWGQPVASGHATAVRNEIVFPPARAKFVRVTLTASDPVNFWSIHELQLFKTAGQPEPPPPRPVQTPEPLHPPQIQEPLHPPEIAPSAEEKSATPPAPVLQSKSGTVN